MNSDLQWLYFVVEGGAVQRFHTRPGLTPYTDAAHSHGVALLCHRLTGGAASANLLMAALTHDLGEQYAGDMSAPAKRALHMRERLKRAEDAQLAKYGLAFSLTEEEARVLNLADQLEGMLWCCRERFLGNTYVELVYNKWYRWSLQAGFTELERPVWEAVTILWGLASAGCAPSFDVFEEEVEQ